MKENKRFYQSIFIIFIIFLSIQVVSFFNAETIFFKPETYLSLWIIPFLIVLIVFYIAFVYYLPLVISFEIISPNKGTDDLIISYYNPQHFIYDNQPVFDVNEMLKYLINQVE